MLPYVPSRDSGTLSPAQVAAELGVDEKTVRNWIHAGLVASARTPAGRYRLAPSVVPALRQLGEEIPLNLIAMREHLRATGQDMVGTKPSARASKEEPSP
jgi:MerR family regulatory protein